MDEHFCAGILFSNGGVIGEMVEMPVSQPEPDDLEAAAPGFVQQTADRVIGSIKDDRLLRDLIADKEAICLGDTAGIHQHDHSASVRI